VRGRLGFVFACSFAPFFVAFDHPHSKIKGRFLLLTVFGSFLSGSFLSGLAARLAPAAHVVFFRAGPIAAGALSFVFIGLHGFFACFRVSQN